MTLHLRNDLRISNSSPEVNWRDKMLDLKKGDIMGYKKLNF